MPLPPSESLTAEAGRDVEGVAAATFVFRPVQGPQTILWGLFFRCTHFTERKMRLRGEKQFAWGDTAKKCRAGIQTQPEFISL